MVGQRRTMFREEIRIMNESLLALLAVTPIAVVFLLLVVMRRSAKLAMLMAYLATLALALTVWGQSFSVVAGATANGIVTALTLLFIIFGAILLLQTVEESGAIRAIRRGFSDLTPDRRIQAIIIAWMFGSMIEGASGFGTPAAVAALLIATRTIAPLKAALTSPNATIAFNDLFGSGIDASSQLLHAPGTILILSSLTAFGLYRMSGRAYARAWSRSARTMIGAAPGPTPSPT